MNNASRGGGFDGWGSGETERYLTFWRENSG